MWASPSSQFDSASSLTCTVESFRLADTTVTALFVSGEVDIATCGTLDDVLTELLTRHCGTVIVDLTEVRFCSAGGFAMLIEAAHSVVDAGGHFAMVSRSRQIARLCARLWPSRSVPCHRDMTAALTEVRLGAPRKPSVEWPGDAWMPYPDREPRPEPSDRHMNDRHVDRLLVSAGHGDVGALSDLYEITAPAVFGLLRGVHLSREAAERATEEVYLQIWRTAPRFDPDDGTAYSLLMRTARREVARWLTSRLSWGALSRPSGGNTVLDENA